MIACLATASSAFAFDINSACGKALNRPAKRPTKNLVKRGRQSIKNRSFSAQILAVESAAQEVSKLRDEDLTHAVEAVTQDLAQASPAELDSLVRYFLAKIARDGSPEERDVDFWAAALVDRAEGSAPASGLKPVDFAQASLETQTDFFTARAAEFEDLKQTKLPAEELAALQKLFQAHTAAFLFSLPLSSRLKLLKNFLANQDFGSAGIINDASRIALQSWFTTDPQLREERLADHLAVTFFYCAWGKPIYRADTELLLESLPNAFPGFLPPELLGDTSPEGIERLFEFFSEHNPTASQYSKRKH